MVKRAELLFRSITMVLVLGTVTFDLVADFGKLPTTLIEAVTISNSLIALTVGVALAWGSTAVKRANTLSSGLTTTDRVMVIVLVAVSLAYLATAVFNVTDAPWIR